MQNAGIKVPLHNGSVVLTNPTCKRCIPPMVPTADRTVCVCPAGYYSLPEGTRFPAACASCHDIVCDY